MDSEQQSGRRTVGGSHRPTIGAVDRRTVTAAVAGALAGLGGSPGAAADAARGQARRGGKPKKKCPDGKKRCGKRCYDLQTDERRCGTCGTRCAPTEFCRDGVCVGCDVCPVGCPHATIQGAVDAAGGGAIQVCPGRYAERMTIVGEATIRGAGRADTIVDAGGSGRPLSVAEGGVARLSGMALVGGAAESGAGVLNQGTLDLVECDVADNTASGSGGFGGMGGGILNAAGATLTMTRGAIRDNAVGIGEGGGLHNNFGVATLDDCTVSGNTAVADGGGFAGGIANRGRLTLTGCTIADNEASANGGGVLSLERLDATDLTVSGNRAGNGGGLSVSGRTAISGGAVRANEALAQGGGIQGGGIPDAPMVVEDVVFEDNVAGGDGGAIDGVRGVELTRCTVRNNEAGYRGGGVSIGGDLLARATTFEGNVASDDGGAIICHSGTVRLAGGGVVGNTAGGAGGGIRNVYGTVTLSDGTILQGNMPDDCAGCEP